MKDPAIDYVRSLPLDDVRALLDRMHARVARAVAAAIVLAVERAVQQEREACVKTASAQEIATAHCPHDALAMRDLIVAALQARGTEQV